MMVAAMRTNAPDRRGNGFLKNRQGQAQIVCKQILRICRLFKIPAKPASVAVMNSGLLIFLAIRPKSPPAEGVQDRAV